MVASQPHSVIAAPIISAFLELFKILKHLSKYRCHGNGTSLLAGRHIVYLSTDLRVMHKSNTTVSTRTPSTSKFVCGKAVGATSSEGI